ncbi:hypothetical protein [Phenylobacterium sp. J367]|uniref:hypothetical protein n=1 Tax=Phenylobacterium sp. J367 TaxID=2898435 RepID=UPI002150D788|nr:hypothetical protein [Phenylobacterium sp. J367]MCR5877826.1 hypothetical protein [Phenylobacterium sp. J367]
MQEFDKLGAHVERMLAMQAGFAWASPGHMAFGIALDGLETAALHFTGRRHYYDALRRDVRAAPAGAPAGAPDFETLRPYAARLRALQDLCRPFGRDYLALEIAQHALATCAYHFTREAAP